MDVEYISENGEIISRREESHVPQLSTWVLLDDALWEVIYVATNSETGALEATIASDPVALSPSRL